MANDVDDVTDDGSNVQIRGAATGYARSPLAV